MKRRFLLLLLAIGGCQQQPIKKNKPSIVKVRDEFRSTIIAPAHPSAKKPEIGNHVTIDYSCWLADEQNQPTKHINNSEAPFTFLLGARRVIEGLDKGVQLMQLGEQRRFIFPPSLAYGNTGLGTLIPPQATLIFDVTLRAII